MQQQVEGVQDSRAYPLPGESAAEFTTRVRPSCVSPEDVEWIQIMCPWDVEGVVRVPVDCHGAATSHARQVIDEYKEAYIKDAPSGMRIPASAKENCFREIYRAAIRAGDKCGKWMLFVSPRQADEAWGKIAEAVESGKLGDSAAIAPCGAGFDQRTVVICVYVGDFSDRTECERVLRGIKSLGLKVNCAFKPDVLSNASLVTKSLIPLKLTNSWQLHYDILDKVFPVPAHGRGSRKGKGFDLEVLA